MRTLGIFAKTFPREDLEQLLVTIQENGFTTMQFNLSCIGLPPMPDKIPEGILERAAKAIDDSQVKMVGLSATFNMCHPNSRIRERGLSRLEILAKACVRFDNRLLTLCTGTRDAQDKWAFHPDNASPAAWLDLCKCMEKAIVTAERYGVYLGIEPELANVVASPIKAKQLLEEMQTDRLRIILDPANLFEIAPAEEVKYRLAEAVDLLAPYISMIHAKDRSATGDFVAPGNGVVPFRFFLDQLDQAQVTAPLVAHGFGEEEAARVADFLKSI